MEEDRRKKKNKKKKKNKEAITLEDRVPIKVSESTSNSQSHATERGPDIDCHVSAAMDASDDAGGKMDADMDDHLSSGIKRNLAYHERQCWMDREASFQKIIEQLQAEKDARIEKEAIFMEKVKEFLKEKDENLQKLACQEETIKQLRNEKVLFLQKEASLVEKLEQVVKENDVIIQKMDYLEETVKGLQWEKDAYLQKENSFEEYIVALNNDNTELRAKFSENGNVYSQSESMHGLVKKSVSENLELVEKVNAVLGREAVATLSADVAKSSVLTHDFSVGPEANRMKPVSHSAQPLEEIMVKADTNTEGVNDESGGSQVAISSEDMNRAAEIVQVPLYEREVKGNSFEVATQNDEKTEASLIDAPLIGAPFRFISFIARYVSGADLVNENAGNSV